MYCRGCLGLGEQPSRYMQEDVYCRGCLGLGEQPSRYTHEEVYCRYCLGLGEQPLIPREPRVEDCEVSRWCSG